MKKALTELLEITNKYGYWSKEVRAFNENVEGVDKMKLNSLVLGIIRDQCS